LLVALNRTNNANLKLNWAAVVVVVQLGTHLLLCCLPEAEEMDTSCGCNAQACGKRNKSANLPTEN
jgi:hypothetical protein